MATKENIGPVTRSRTHSVEDRSAVGQPKELTEDGQGRAQEIVSDPVVQPAAENQLEILQSLILQQIANTNQQFANMASQLNEQIRNQFSETNCKIDSLTANFSSLQLRVQGMEQSLQQNQERTNNLNIRVTSAEEQLQRTTTELRNEIDIVQRQCTAKLQQEKNVTTEKLVEIAALTENLASTTEELSNRITQLEENPSSYRALSNAIEMRASNADVVRQGKHLEQITSTVSHLQGTMDQLTVEVETLKRQPRTMETTAVDTADLYADSSLINMLRRPAENERGISEMNLANSEQPYSSTMDARRIPPTSIGTCVTTTTLTTSINNPLMTTVPIVEQFPREPFSNLPRQFSTFAHTTQLPAMNSIGNQYPLPSMNRIGSTGVVPMQTTHPALGRLTLPYFSGEGGLTFPMWWSEAMHLFDQLGIPDTSRLAYLRQSLRGPALHFVASQARSIETYQELGRILQNQFWSPPVQTYIMTEMLQTPFSASKHHTPVEYVRSILRYAKWFTLGIPEVVIVNAIINLLPIDIQTSCRLFGIQTYSQLEHLMSQLNPEVSSIGGTVLGAKPKRSSEDRKQVKATEEDRLSQNRKRSPERDDGRRTPPNYKRPNNPGQQPRQNVMRSNQIRNQPYVQRFNPRRWNNSGPWYQKRNDQRQGQASESGPTKQENTQENKPVSQKPVSNPPADTIKGKELDKVYLHQLSSADLEKILEARKLIESLGQSNSLLEYLQKQTGGAKKTDSNPTKTPGPSN